jgi:hypothetical protein
MMQFLKVMFHKFSRIFMIAHHQLKVPELVECPFLFLALCFFLWLIDITDWYECNSLIFLILLLLNHSLLGHWNLPRKWRVWLRIPKRRASFKCPCQLAHLVNKHWWKWWEDFWHDYALKWKYNKKYNTKYKADMKIQKSIKCDSSSYGTSIARLVGNC